MDTKYIAAEIEKAFEKRAEHERLFRMGMENAAKVRLCLEIRNRILTHGVLDIDAFIKQLEDRAMQGVQDYHELMKGELECTQ